MIFSYTMPMQTTLSIIALIVGLITTGLVVYVLLRLGKQAETPKQDDTGLKLLFQQMGEQTRSLMTRMRHFLRLSAH